MQTEQTQVTPRPSRCKSSILGCGFSTSLPCYFPSLGRQPSTGTRLEYLSFLLSLKIAFKSQDHGPILQKGKQSFHHNTEIFGYFRMRGGGDYFRRTDIYHYTELHSSYSLLSYFLFEVLTRLLDLDWDQETRKQSSRHL